MGVMTTIEARLHELRELARHYAKAEAERSYLEHFRKSKLALLMKDAELNGIATVNAQERDARCHPEYLELLRGLQIATEAAERAKWELQIARLGADVWRTQQANRRTEIETYMKGAGT